MIYYCCDSPLIDHYSLFTTSGFARRLTGDADDDVIDVDDDDDVVAVVGCCSNSLENRFRSQWPLGRKQLRGKK